MVSIHMTKRKLRRYARVYQILVGFILAYAVVRHLTAFGFGDGTFLGTYALFLLWGFTYSGCYSISEHYVKQFEDP